jgi:aquaporin Z
MMAGAFSVGSISGGVFNPAVGTGPILIDMFLGDGSLTNLWIYWVGPLLGGVAAAGAFDLMHTESAASQ